MEDVTYVNSKVLVYLITFDVIVMLFDVIMMLFFKNMFLGRRFGRTRTVFDGHRRYLPLDDDLRNRKLARRRGYEYSSDEVLGFPEMKTYENYINNGNIATQLNEEEYQKRLSQNHSLQFNHIDEKGVYGMWCFKDLPYAKDIHWTMDYMHTSNNVCHDYLNSVRPTHSAIPGIYYAFKNRTYDEGVVSVCKDEKIFKVLYGDLKPDWVLEVDECIQMDKSMNNIMGQMKSQELVKNVMRAGKAEKSHDTIYWCIVYARLNEMIL